MGFVVDTVALGQAIFRLLQLSTVNIIPPMLHTHILLHAASTRRTNGRNLGTLGEVDKKLLPLLPVLKMI